MALYDDRLNHTQDKILGKAKGNLAYGKFIFTVYPKYGISLKDTNLNKVLSFVHKFERENFMEKGSKAFSITYVIAYALTNSHHSIDYSNEKTIDLESIFQEIGDINSCKFAEIDDSNNDDWAIDIAKNKRLIDQKPLIKNRKSYTGETSSDVTRSMSMRSMSLKIDSLRQELQSILQE
ncbi:reverse transcriptase domain-containing protein [Tanacetum coccineum]